MSAHSLGRVLISAIVLAGWAAPGFAAGVSCTHALGAPMLVDGPLKTLGTAPALAHVLLEPRHTYLIQVDEHDNDSLVEVLDARSTLIARHSQPERRTGARRAGVAGSDSPAILIRVKGKEHAGVAGTATVQVID